MKITIGKLIPLFFTFALMLCFAGAALAAGKTPIPNDEGLHLSIDEIEKRMTVSESNGVAVYNENYGSIHIDGSIVYVFTKDKSAKEFNDIGWNMRLMLCRYSYNELLAAQEKLAKTLIECSLFIPLNDNSSTGVTALMIDILHNKIVVEAQNLSAEQLKEKLSEADHDMLSVEYRFTATTKARTSLYEGAETTVKTIGRIPAKTALYVTEKNGKYLKTYYNGNYGYILASAVKIPKLALVPDEAEEPDGIRAVAIKDTDVMSRDDRNTKLGNLVKWQEVYFIRLESTHVEGSWAVISFNGEDGFVKQECLDIYFGDREIEICVE